jgi:Fe-S-cluster containining protein
MALLSSNGMGAFFYEIIMISDNDELYNIIKVLSDTREEEILKQTQELYASIANTQAEWYKESGFTCPEGCGECCRNFEPDLLDCEALFMAAWIIENQSEVADKILEGDFPFPENKGCPFWDENKEYHCTIYGGRPFICRFFGACGSKDKDGKTVFKPCKFYPANILASHKPPLAHRQYSEKETLEIFGRLPIVMTDIMETAVSLNPNNQTTEELRSILPKYIKHLKWIYNIKKAAPAC